MTTRYLSTTPRYSSLLALFGLGVFVAQGCGNDSNPAPTPPTVTGGTSGSGSGAKGGSGGKGGSANSGNESGNGPEGGTGDTGAIGGSGGKGGSGANGGSGGKGGSGAKGGSGGKGGSGNSGNESGSDNVGGAGAGNVNCDPVGDYQCYPCPPTTNVEYLNRCNDTSCSKFDNATRIQNFNGTLPPL